MVIVDRMIEWGDCDAAGIVFYPNYFRWMDGAFHDFSRSLDFDQVSLSRDHGLMGTPLIESSCRFLAPARFYQRLSISVAVDRVGTTSMTLVYRFGIGETEIAVGQETRGFVKRSGSKITKAPIPNPIRTNLEKHIA